MAGSRPSLSISSTSVRCSRAIDPWWARTSSSPARSLSWPQRRSASRRELTKTIVDRWARISSSNRGAIAGQMLRRGACGADASPPRSAPRSRSVMSSTGTSMVSSIGLRTPASTMTTSRPVPPRKRATSLSGRCVADRPMRCGSLSASAAQALEADGEVGTALGAGERVDLVDDHRGDAAQRLARCAGEHEEQRLGRGDEDVRGVAHQVAALDRRRVTAAHRGAHLAELLAASLRGE